MKWHLAAIAELLCCREIPADGGGLSEYLHIHVLRKVIQMRTQQLEFPEVHSLTSTTL